jgi:23S rRNA (guanosine2251-2'-O)-methyltransferase
VRHSAKPSTKTLGKGAKSKSGRGTSPSGRPAAGSSARPSARREERRGAVPRSGARAARMRGLVGLHAVREILRIRPESITRFVLKSDYESSAVHVELAKLAGQKGVRVEKQNAGFFDRIALHHQGIFVESNDAPALNWSHLKSSDQSCLLALDGLEDIMNLGAIIRTAWLFQVDGIFLPEARTAPMTPAVAKVASGGVEHVPVESVPNLLNPLKDLKEHGFWVFGLAEEGAQSLWTTEIPKKVIWVTGAEDKGIRSTIRGICDQMVAIPQAPSGSSFNASVATAIVLAETRRQWSQK